jgi:hypothetical protein
MDALRGSSATELPGGDDALHGGGASDLPGGGADAPRGSDASDSGRGAGASQGDDAPAARGGGVAVGGGGAPPAPDAGRLAAGAGAVGSPATHGSGGKREPGAASGRASSDAGGRGGPTDGAPPAPAPGSVGRRPLRTLGALALGLCAVGLAVGSGADFTARTANPSNVFSAGAISMQNSKDGTAILNATGMKPGGAAKTGIVDIENTGSMSGRFTLTRDQLTNTDVNGDNPIQFAAKVVVGVVDCGKFTTGGPVPTPPTCGDQDDRTLMLGPLSIQNSPIELGDYDAGEKHRYRFEASLDQSAGTEFSGDSSSARYVFDAKQTP